MHKTVNFSNLTFNLSAAGGSGTSPAASEETSSEFLESSSEISSEDTSEDTSEGSSELSSEIVYIDYTDQLTSIQTGINDANTRLELTITLGFIALAIFVSLTFFRIFNWFWRDL